MSILLPGGAGYIGSHTAVELLKAGKEIVIIPIQLFPSLVISTQPSRLPNMPMPSMSSTRTRTSRST